MEISRVEFAEGSLFSEKRLYLRMIRERLIFDTCAAPFGSGYFFSCRTVFMPPIISIWHILVILFVLNGMLGMFFQILGFLYGTIAFVGLLAAVALVMRNAISMELQDLDSFLVKTPGIGPLYEWIFRRETYHRMDTRLCYLHMIPSIVKELAEDLAAEKGLKLVHQYEQAPVLGELYKRSEMSESTDLPDPEPPPRLSI